MRSIYKPRHKTSPTLGYLSAGHGNKRILEVDGSPLHLGEQHTSYLVLIDRRVGYPYLRIVLIAKMALDCGPYVTERSRPSWLNMDADVRHFARRIADTPRDYNGHELTSTLFFLLYLDWRLSVLTFHFLFFFSILLFSNGLPDSKTPNAMLQ